MLKFTLVKAIEYSAEVYFYAAAALKEGESIPPGVNSTFDEASDSVLYEVFPFEGKVSDLKTNEQIQVNVLGAEDFTVSPCLNESLRWFIEIEAS